MEFTKGNIKMQVLGEPIGDYTIIKRETKFQPYIAAWLFVAKPDDWGEPYWSNGNYFDTYIDAVNYAIEKTR